MNDEYEGKMRNQELNKCLATCHFLNSYKTKGNLLVITQSFLSLLETAAVTGSIFALVSDDGIFKIELQNVLNHFNFISKRKQQIFP